MDERQKPLAIRISDRLTSWVGSPASLVVHTIFFIGVFALGLFDVPLEQILLVLTTAVSLEAIYLAIFIQMTVNRHTESLQDVGEDIEELGEEVEDLGVDLEELGEEVEDIGEDIEEISSQRGGSS
jgi:low affinity Fe/Cu permease